VSAIRIQIEELQRSGVPTLQIAQRLGVAEATVHYHLRRLASPPEVVCDAEEVVPAAVDAVRTRDQVARLLGEGMSRIAIARTLQMSKSTVSYHARRLGEPIDERFRRRYDWAAVQRYYDLGYSIRECAQAFGFATSSWSEAVNRGLLVSRPRARPVELAFAPNTHRNRRSLKLRLIQEGLKQDRCECCGISEWLGKPLTMTLHHINGDRLDNRIQNLQLLCANCHSQTPSYGGRNGRRLGTGQAAA
jgi:DNA-binding CsgD family transcriptional regulator